MLGGGTACFDFHNRTATVADQKSSPFSCRLTDTAGIGLLMHAKVFTIG